MLSSPWEYHSPLSCQCDALLQILVEKTLIEGIGLQWAGLEYGASSCTVPAAAASHLAVRNHALLTQRMESDLAASRTSYSLTSPGDTPAPQLEHAPVLLCRVVSCRDMSYCVIMSSHWTPYRAMPYHTIPYRTVPYPNLPYHTILHCIVPYLLHHVMYMCIVAQGHLSCSTVCSGLTTRTR